MKKLKTLFISLTVITTLLHAREPFPDLTNAQNSINSFDTKLYQTLSRQEGNVNYSAISIYSLLYALQQGAEGKTREQICQIIDLEPEQKTDTQLKKIITDTENMTNSLWYKKTLNIKNDYQRFIKAYAFFIKAVDFYQGSQVRKEINNYISKQTDRFIENFLQEDLPQDTQFVLLNTLYFNQKWKTSFDASNTRKQSFHKNSQTQINIPIMHKTTVVPYYENQDFQIVEFVYKDERYSMIVILPYDYDYDFTDIELHALLQTFNQKKRHKQVQIFFPKFDLTSNYNLIPVLRELGISAAFDPSACNLSKIFTDSKNLYVDTAIHQVRIQVTEKETKAAAVTMFGVKAAAAEPEILFNANHPFAYVIRDNKTGINLFTGIVRNPE